MRSFRRHNHRNIYSGCKEKEAAIKAMEKKPVTLSKAINGEGMIRADIGLKNRQIINETYSFRCFLIL